MKIRDHTKVVFSEGCLSVRGFVADVPRYRTIEVYGENSVVRKCHT